MWAIARFALVSVHWACSSFASVTNRTAMPAECRLKFQTASRTAPSALAGNRSNGDWTSCQPWPSTPSCRTSSQWMPSASVKVNSSAERLLRATRLINSVHHAAAMRTERLMGHFSPEMGRIGKRQCEVSWVWKPEIRISKFERNPKHEISNDMNFVAFRASDLRFPSDFGFRDSYFEVGSVNLY